MPHVIRWGMRANLATCFILFAVSCTYDWPSPEVEPDSGQEAGIDGGADGGSRGDAAFDASPPPDADARPDTGARPDAASEPDARPDPGEPCNQADALRCTGESSVARERCTDGYWAAAEACADGEVCTDTPSPGSCIEVAEVCRGNAGQAVCDAEGTMYLCGDNGVPEDELACGSQRLCEAGTDQQACFECVPNEYRCTQAKLEQCADDGSGFELVEECATVALCNADAGACTDAACSSDVAVCMQNGLYECNADRTALRQVATCDSADLCDADHAECDTCLPGTTRCSGNSVVTCTHDGQSTTTAACTEPTPLCVGNGTCVQCREAQDCPAPSGPCQRRSCNTGTGQCEETNATAGTSCNGDGFCNSEGECDECRSYQDCPRPSQECRERVCNDGQCDVEVLQDGEECADGRCASGGSCEECTLDTHCQGHPDGPRCNGNQCAECALDNHCSGDFRCEGGACVGCGNGRVDPGEDCDLAIPGTTVFTCSQTCQSQDVYDGPCFPSQDDAEGRNPVCGNTSTERASQSCVASLGVCASHATSSQTCPENQLGDEYNVSYVISTPYCLVACEMGADCPDHLPNCQGSTMSGLEDGFCTPNLTSCSSDADCTSWRRPTCNPWGYCAPFSG